MEIPFGQPGQGANDFFRFARLVLRVLLGGEHGMLEDCLIGNKLKRSFDLTVTIADGQSQIGGFDSLTREIGLGFPLN